MAILAHNVFGGGVGVLRRGQIYHLKGQIKSECNSVFEVEEASQAKQLLGLGCSHVSIFHLQIIICLKLSL